MCQRLRAIQQSIITYAGQFDARTLTAAQASEAVRFCAQIEASAASIKALAAARSAEGNSWQHAGYREPPRLEVAHALPRPAVPGDEAGLFEHPQVLRDGGLAHGEGLGHIEHPGVPCAQPGQDRPPGGVGQRAEGTVQLPLAQLGGGRL